MFEAAQELVFVGIVVLGLSPDRIAEVVGIVAVVATAIWNPQ